MAKEYNARIVKDISLGFKSWETLDRSIDSSAWCYAQKMVPKKQGGQNQGSKGSNSSNSSNSSQKLCTTWNTFKKDGCSWENSNPGETCVFAHYCSSCKQRGFPNRRHKAINCRDSANSNSQNSNTQNSNSQNANVTSNSAASSAVVTSE